MPTSPRTVMPSEVRYTKVPETLLMDPEVTHLGVRLWSRIDRFLGAGATAWPSIETLAIELDCSPATIRRESKKLVIAGWLKKTERVGTTNQYVTTTANEAVVQERYGIAIAARVAATEPRRAKQRAISKAKRRGPSGPDYGPGLEVVSHDALGRPRDAPSPTIPDMDPPSTNERGTPSTGDWEKDTSLEGINIRTETLSPQQRSADRPGGHLMRDTDPDHLAEMVTTAVQGLEGDSDGSCLNSLLASLAERPTVTHPRRYLEAILNTLSTDADRHRRIRSYWRSDVLGQDDDYDRERLLEVMDAVGCAHDRSESDVIWLRMKRDGIKWPGAYMSSIFDDFGPIGVEGVNGRTGYAA